MRLDGKLAVVTGAGSGLGQALAGVLAARGCRLALADIDEAGLQQTAERVGGAPLLQRLDVADRHAVHDFAARVERECGVPDVVINNAGVGHSQLLKDLSYEDFEWLMSINFWGMVYGSKAFLDRMLKRGSGTIVNISSCMGFVGMPASGAYNTSKFAIRGYTETLRCELRGSGVNALCVHPGAIRTHIARSTRFHDGFDGSADKDQFVAMFERQALLTPERVAEAVVRAVERRRVRLVIGTDARAIDWLARLLPESYEVPLLALMKRMLRH